MATGSKGFSVTIAAVDQASPTLDKINRHLAAMSAPAERFNKSVSKFADVSGINRMAEGMQTLGSRSLDVFRSLDRVAPALAGITGAASLAGMAALVQRWSQLGQQTYLTGQRLGVPVDKLTGLQGAARGAGLGAKDLADGMGALDEKLRSATFRGDAGARSIFKQLGVDFGNEKDGAANAVTAFGKVADGIKRINDAKNGGRGASQRAAEGLGMGALWPLLIKGSAGINALAADAANLGGVISPEAAKRAEELEHSFTRLNIAVEGVENRLGDQWGQAVKPYIDGTTDWIAKNKDLATSYGDIVVAIGALGAIKPAAWLARILGISALTTPAILASPLLLSGDTNPDATPGGFRKDWVPDNGAAPTPYTGPTETFGQAYLRLAPSWLGGTPSALPSIMPDIEEQVRKQAQMQGLNADHMVRLARAEAGGYENVSPAGAIGPMQLMPGTAAMMGVNPHNWRQNVYGGTKYYAGLLNQFHGDYAVADAAYNAGPGNAGVGHFAATGDPSRLPNETQKYVEKINGHVRVDVNLTGAPPGTTAKATASGSASASPPTVATAMQH